MNNKDYMRHAVSQGTKPWGRSKIMIVGDGRAGKTALANRIMGEEFRHTESTIGISQMTCDVKHAEVGAGSWEEYVKPSNELEAALAKIVAARRKDGVTFESDDANIVLTGEGQDDNVNTTEASQLIVQGAAHPSSLPGKTKNTKKSKMKKSDEAEGNDEDNELAELAEKASGLAIDEALVMKYLANLSDSTKFVISLFDYGGQTVFNVIHHLFLTRYGVYTLVFNMEQLVSEDPAVREHCLSTISFWLNSIVVHTWDANTETMAPIVIVGTHKDIVSENVDHQRISKMLHDKFSSSVAWPFILENEDDAEDTANGNAEAHAASVAMGDRSLCFFPVDNRKSRKDTTVVKMMKLIEDVIDKSDYVHAERPLTWLQTMDKLTSCGKPYLPLSEVEKIAEQCEVPRAAVPSLLSFLHEMGVLMWHDDIALRDVVILDAVAYFVTPVTTIICKHLATAMDATRHVVDVHKKCSKLYYDAWMKMVHRGIVNTDIISTLLEECGQQATVVIHLMVKFGLVVPLQIAKQLYGQQAGTVSKARAAEYLVPALLPQLREAPVGEQAAVDCSDEFINTCYFVFSCSSVLAESSMLTGSDCSNLGFLPRGLFERLICKAVEWCRDTSAVQSLQSQPLFQDAAVLIFGNQKFRMRAFHDRNCIQIDFTRGNPLAVHQRLCDQLQQILDECMKSLRFFSMVPYPVLIAVDSGEGDKDSFRERQLIQLEYLRHIAKTHTGLHAPNGSKLLNKAQLKEQYGGWLVDDALRSDYDVFISYRWGTLDSRFTERLRDRFSTFNVGEDCRAVSVFLDNKRLRDGRNFVNDFSRALVNSYVIVPVVSSDALVRMADHDPNYKDNVLLEWIMALECFHSPDSRVARVLPVLFGRRDGSSDVIGDLYREGVLDTLPTVHPAETVRCAIQLLKDNGVQPRSGIDTCTVHGVLAELKTLLGFCTWNASDPSVIVPEAAEKVVASLQDVLDEKAIHLAAQTNANTTTDSADGASGGGSADAVDFVTSVAPSSPLPTGSPTTNTKRTVKMIAEDIRVQLGLDAAIGIAQVLDQALEMLGDDVLKGECAGQSLLVRAEKIYIVVVG